MKEAKKGKKGPSGRGLFPARSEVVEGKKEEG
jgi:hypothetical protein